MAFLVHPLPPIPVYVRKEYLYDLEEGHGEYTPGIWISVKSTQYEVVVIWDALTGGEPPESVKLSGGGLSITGVNIKY